MKLLSFTCILFVSTVLGGAPSMFSIHEFEDGFVERSLAIIVRDQTVHVEYSIGLNETTAQEVMVAWELKDQDKNEKIESATRRAEPKPHPPNPQKSLVKPVAANPANRGKSSSHAISPELMKNLKRLAPSAIERELVILCNGKPVDVIDPELGPPPRHPFTLTVKFQFELPDSKTCDLQIDDRNFRQQSGAVKQAAKAMGQAMIMRSNVAPILVRADRLEIANPAQHPLPAMKVRLGFAPNSTK